MIALRNLTGMPVVMDGKALGRVERAVLTDGLTRLRGVIVRHGLGMARWVSRSGVTMIGRQCVLIACEPQRLPKDVDRALGCCYGTNGECLGIVTDALLNEQTLRTAALEIGAGPLYTLAGPRRYAVRFRTHATREAETAVIVPNLLNWEEVAEGRRKSHERSEIGDVGRNRVCAGRRLDDDAGQPEA